MKPLKGEIHDWEIMYYPKEMFRDEQGEFPKNLGYLIRGVPHGHPNFVDYVRTSPIVKHDRSTGEVETLNSRYLLVGLGAEKMYLDSGQGYYWVF